MVRIRPDEVLHFHLLKLARAQNKIARRDLVAKRFSDLRDAERNLSSQRRLNVQEINENPLRGLRTKVSEGGRIVLIGSGSQRRPKHHVEMPLIRKIS